MKNKTHFRKAFDSPYLASVDIVEPTDLTIARVSQEPDKTKKTKDVFNTAHFAERELRPGEPLKPMILNATNSKFMRDLTGSSFIEDWQGVRVRVYVDKAVKFGKDVTEGLRLARVPELPELRPGSRAWANAIAAYKRDGNLEQVWPRVTISDAHRAQLIAECEQGAGA